MNCYQGMPKLSILHISDIHIGNTFLHESVEDIAIRTVDDIIDNSNVVDCVVVTGDIFTGKSKSDISKEKSKSDISKAL